MSKQTAPPKAPAAVTVEAKPAAESETAAPLSDTMQAMLLTFQTYPGRWFYHLEQWADEIEATLVKSGLVLRDEYSSKGKVLVRYCGPVPEGTPPALDMNAA